MTTPQPQTWSVSEITAYIKHLLEDDPALHGVNVSGEVSNLTYHRSGHVYFSVKDREAQLSCVMFRAYAQQSVQLKEGDQVVVTGEMTIYAPRGNYQMMVRAVKKAGLGDLFQKFVELKEKLQREGLFDSSRKKKIPLFPETIAVITSPTGAAIRDILQTLERRYNRLKVILIPTTVQGEQGAKSIITSLQAAQTTGADVIILARGGGSIEDLWNFNEESVARAIAASQIPVISGIGHESDVTIADFVADVRASTPTAAAERVVPEKAAVLATLNEYEKQLRHSLRYFIDFKRQVLDDYSNRLEQAVKQTVRNKRHELDVLAATLRGLDVTDLLQKGYTLTLKDGEIQKDASAIHPGDRIETVFAKGRIRSEVTDV
ncbi:MAG: exodeoxyribonuclease VII large subunit [Bacteroidia bacterium]|nr:exodeoxyribonuclease VII large subunit [Bacteroidia bacterium]